MRVAMYYPWIYLKGGIERTIIELACRSRHDWSIFSSYHDQDGTFPEISQLDVRPIGRVSVKRDFGSVASACASLLRRSYDWSEFDAVLIHCDGLGNLVAMRSHGAPLLSLCHTPLKIAYDHHAKKRWQRMFRPGLPSRIGVAAFKTVDRMAWRRYERVFAVSDEVNRRLTQGGLVSATRSEVLRPGVDAQRLQPSGRRENFFLIPGRIMWSKNVELGLEAFIRHKEGVAGDMRLVVAGMVDEKSRPYLARLQEASESRDDVEFIQNPTDVELFDLYDRCHTVLFTPPNEDWGIVPLEAMAFAKPVIAVARGGPAESVVDGVTGFLCRDTPDAFAAAMTVLQSNEALYSRLSAAALVRARQFDWSHFVGRIDGYLDSLSETSRVTQPAVV
jgi:glycosyltransferase involved in cell wall biosynthesis